MTTVAHMPKSRDAEQLAEALAAAISSGDSQRALDLTRQLERLLADAGPANRQKSTARTRSATKGFAARPTVVPVTPSPRPPGNVRQVVTAALAEVGVPARARLLSEYAAARF